MKNMKPYIQYLISTIFVFVALLNATQADDKPDLMLAQVYHSGIDVQHYWVSSRRLHKRSAM
jgi:hypothetical protein